MAREITFKIAAGTAQARERQAAAVAELQKNGVECRSGFNPIDGYTVTIFVETPVELQRNGMSKVDAFAKFKREKEVREAVFTSCWIQKV